MERKVCEFYKADCLRAIVNNTATFEGAVQIGTSLRELFYQAVPEKDCSEEAQEIIDALSAGLARLRGGEGEE